MSKDFFTEQNDITAAKIKIYEKYILGYLPKILLTFKHCYIADLFCGAGKNGNKDGSALTLIKQVKYLFTNSKLNGASVEVKILFNDKKKENVDNLKKSLQNFSHPNIELLSFRNDEFKTILSEILETAKSDSKPKFFFLDPFTYSDVTIDDLKDLMNLRRSEVFLFVPIFHSYRFANKKNYAEDHKTRVFVEQFTMKGIADYDGIEDFMQSIKLKIKTELNLDYVRPILLDDGNCKNAIFLLTKHLAGMLLMNRIACKQSDDCSGINIKEQKSGQEDVFGTTGTTRHLTLAARLREELKKQHVMTNADIVKLVIQEEFLPKHAKDILKKLKDENKIVVTDGDKNDVTEKSGKWNIAEKTPEHVTFTYVD